MNIRPYPGLTIALATAVASTATPLPAAADDLDEPMVEHCIIHAVTVEEVAAGVTSEIDCYQVPADTPLDMPMARGTVVYALIYDGANGTGTPIGTVTGASCTGGATAFPSGSSWDNKISSTELVACGSAKHYQSANFSGNNQFVTGSGVVWNMNATLNNDTSSIQYAP